MAHGPYGEFKVLVDGDVVIDGGAKVILGIMPSADRIIDAVRKRMQDDR